MRVFIAHSIASARRCLGLVLATLAVGCGAGEEEALQPVDAGATAPPDAWVSSARGGVGVISILDHAIFAAFARQATAVHFDDAPGCVFFLQPYNAFGGAYVPAGTLLVGGPVVGTPGAMAAPITPPIPPPAGLYTYMAGPVFAETDELLVEVSLAGNRTMPTMGVQTVRPPAAEPVELLRPAPGGVMTLRSTEPFEMAWTVPAGGNLDHHMFVGVYRLMSTREGRGPTMMGDLLCGFAIDAGRGTIPARVLAEVAGLLGGLPLRSSDIDIGAGDWKEYTGRESSYVIQVTRGLPGDRRATRPGWTSTTLTIE